MSEPIVKKYFQWTHFKSRSQLWRKWKGSHKLIYKGILKNKELRTTKTFWGSRARWKDLIHKIKFIITLNDGIFVLVQRWTYWLWSRDPRNKPEQIFMAEHVLQMPGGRNRQFAKWYLEIWVSMWGVIMKLNTYLTPSTNIVSR